MQKSIAAFLLTAFAVISPLAASAAPITVPAGLNPGDQYRLAFVTSTTRDATPIPASTYNTFVTSVANSVPELAGLGTTWKVIGSTFTSDAKTITGTSGIGVPIYRLDGLPIADNYLDLWDGDLDRPLNVTEQGQQIPVEEPQDHTTYVFTGTDSFGDEAFSPAPAFLGVSNVRVGNALDTIDWINWNNFAPDFPNTYTLHFYAMSGVLTVVPEPSTLALATLAVLGIAVASIRRRCARKT